MHTFLYSSRGSHSKYTGVVCHSLLQWVMFCQNSLLWPVHLGWPYNAWLTASPSYASPFPMTRQWSMKGQTWTVYWKAETLFCQQKSISSRLWSSRSYLWVLDSKEGEALQNWCLRTVLLEKTPESPLDSKEIKPVNLKGNQLWILIGRADAEAEVPVFWSFDTNSWIIGKVLDVEKDWRQKEKRASEDKMTGWHHRCNGHELGQTSSDGEGQRGLACCSPWHGKVDTTGWLNNNSK